MRARPAALPIVLAAAFSFAAASARSVPPPAASAALREADVAATDVDLILRTRAGLLRAEDERNATDPAIATALAHPLGELRARAVRALGRIGDPASVAVVSRALVDREREVQREAVFALGEIESPDALSSLMRALSSGDAEQRALIAEALAKIAWSPSGRAQAGGLVVTRLLAPGVESHDFVVERALIASWRFGTDAHGLTRAINDAFLRPEPAISEAAVYAASRLGDPRLGGMLELAARDARPAVRAMAARGLGRLARANSAAGASVSGVGADGSGERERSLGRRAILIRRAFDVDPAVRLAALPALEAFPPAEPVLTQEFLNVSLRSSAAGLQRAALSLVGAWRIQHELPTVLRLVTLALPEMKDLFPEAAVALVRLQGSEAVPVLANAARSPHWQQRAAVAAALGAEELARDEDALALQDQLLADRDARVAAAALDAALGSGRADGSVLALAHLGAKDVVVRAVAAAALPELVGRDLTQDEAASALRRASRESMGDASTDVRVTTLEALSKLLGPNARPDLMAAAGDRDWIVRSRAQSLLGKSGEATVPGTANLGRPLAFYVERARDEMRSAPVTLRLETDRGNVDIALATAEAPLTTFQITELARQRFYDGLTFHRVVPDFVAQGGCPRGDGWGHPSLPVRCEINRLPYGTGAVGMALSGKDTGGSQFFLTLSPQPHLDGGYTVIGQVLPESQPVVDSLRRFDTIHRAFVVPSGEQALGRRGAVARGDLP